MDCSRNFKCVRYFPKDIYPRATSEVTISQVAASQMCNFPSGNFPKVRLGPLRRSRLQCEPSTADRMGWGTKRCSQNRLRLRTTARIHLGSYRMGNWTFGKLPHGKIPLESCPLGNILWDPRLKEGHSSFTTERLNLNLSNNLEDYVVFLPGKVFKLIL